MTYIDDILSEYKYHVYSKNEKSCGYYPDKTPNFLYFKTLKSIIEYVSCKIKTNGRIQNKEYNLPDEYSKFLNNAKDENITDTIKLLGSFNNGFYIWNVYIKLLDKGDIHNLMFTKDISNGVFSIGSIIFEKLSENVLAIIEYHKYVYNFSEEITQTIAKNLIDYSTQHVNSYYFTKTIGIQRFLEQNGITIKLDDYFIKGDLSLIPNNEEMLIIALTNKINYTTPDITLKEGFKIRNDIDKNTIFGFIIINFDNNFEVPLW